LRTSSSNFGLFLILAVISCCIGIPQLLSHLLCAVALVAPKI
jgi:hypothetical protein